MLAEIDWMKYLVGTIAALPFAIWMMNRPSIADALRSDLAQITKGVPDNE